MSHFELKVWAATRRITLNWGWNERCVLTLILLGWPVPRPWHLLVHRWWGGYRCSLAVVAKVLRIIVTDPVHQNSGSLGDVEVGGVSGSRSATATAILLGGGWFHTWNHDWSESVVTFEVKILLRLFLCHLGHGRLILYPFLAGDFAIWY